MRTFFKTIVTLAIVGGAAAFAAGPETVENILKSPGKFHEKEVTVVGTVQDFKQKTSKKGNDYFVFQLKGKGEELLNVYSRGKMDPALKADEKVEVSGIFRKEKEVLDFKVKNEIDATPVTKEGKKKFGVKLVKDK